jgi:hypothetical protein
VKRENNVSRSLVAYYTKRRQDVANFLSTIKGNKGLFKERKIKMSHFYVESDRN